MAVCGRSECACGASVLVVRGHGEHHCPTGSREKLCAHSQSQNCLQSDHPCHTEGVPMHRRAPSVHTRTHARTHTCTHRLARARVLGISHMSTVGASYCCNVGAGVSGHRRSLGKNQTSSSDAHCACDRSHDHDVPCILDLAHRQVHQTRLVETMPIHRMTDREPVLAKIIEHWRAHVDRRPGNIIGSVIGGRGHPNPPTLSSQPNQLSCCICAF